MELALFDFDHTITHCDTYSRFLRQIATRQQHAQAWWRVGPWLLAYRLKLISAQRIRRRVTDQVLRGRDAAEIGHLAKAYAEQQLPSMLRPLMLEQIQWHKAQGHTVAIVSAAIDAYLQHWCDAHDLLLICNVLQAQDGKLTGRYANGDCGARKAKIIQQHFDLNRYRRIHAYGDSREDKPMLALAHERWYRGQQIT